MPRHEFTKRELSRGGRKTAFSHAGEEYMLGWCPNPDNYSADIDTPLWDDLLDLLVREKIDRFEILFCGKAGSDGQVGGTGFGITSRKYVQRVYLSYWTPGEATLKSITRNPENTAIFATKLLGLNLQPEHITGIVVRKMNG